MSEDEAKDKASMEDRADPAEDKQPGPDEDEGPRVSQAQELSGRRVPVQRRTAVLVFEEGPYEGTEVRCAFDISMNVYFEYQALASRAEEQDAEAFREVALRFGDEILMEWNLDGEDGEPLPATGEGFLTLPVTAVTDILRAWLDAMVRPTLPLESPSASGTS